MVSARRMRECRFKKLAVAKLITEALLAALEPQGVVRTIGRLRRIAHDPILNLNRGYFDLKVKGCIDLRRRAGNLHGATIASAAVVAVGVTVVKLIAWRKRVNRSDEMPINSAVRIASIH